MEVVVKRGDHLYKISRTHKVNVGDILSANPSITNPEVLPIGVKIIIPQGPSSGIDNSIKGVSSTGLRLNKPGVSKLPRENKIWGQLSDVKAASILAGIVSVPVIFGGAASASSRIIEWGRLAFGAFFGWQSQMKEQCLPLARASERAAAMHGTRPISSLKLGPRKPPPLLRALLHKEKENLGTKPRKSVVVRAGDTLMDIAEKNRIPLWELKRMNFLNSEVIISGDVLVVERERKQASQEIRPGVRRTLRPLYSRLQRSSADSKNVHNMGLGGGEVKKLPLEGRWKLRRKGFQREHGVRKFSSPLSEGVISSPFGWRWGTIHEGVDLAAEPGTPVMAADRGTVAFAGWSGGYGKMLAIQHEAGFTTRYAHCSVIRARVGKHVCRGEVVAEVGSTGVSTGPHLHFEVRRRRKALDPFHWVYL